MKIIKNIRIYILTFIVAYIYYFALKNSFFGVVTISQFDLTYNNWYRLIAVPCLFFSGGIMLGYLIRDCLKIKRHIVLFDYILFLSLIILMISLVTGLAVITGINLLFFIPSSVKVSPAFILLDITHHYQEVFALLGLLASLGITNKKSSL